MRRELAAPIEPPSTQTDDRPSLSGHMRRRNHSRMEPKALDPRSGFEVPLSRLVKDGQTGDLVDRKRADPKHPQEYIRARPERISLPYVRPEPPDRFMAVNILMEDYLPVMGENGAALLTEGEVVTL